MQSLLDFLRQASPLSIAIALSITGTLLVTLLLFQESILTSMNTLLIALIQESRVVLSHRMFPWGHSETEDTRASLDDSDVFFTRVRVGRVFLETLAARTLQPQVLRDIDEIRIDESKAHAQTIVGLMIGRRISQNVRTYILLLLSLVAYVAFCYFLNSTVDQLVVFVLFVLIVGVFINEKTLEYRIKHGYFGSDENEAKEIVRFVIENADKSDFTKGGRSLKIMPEAEALVQEAQKLAGIGEVMP